MNILKKLERFLVGEYDPVFRGTPLLAYDAEHRLPLVQMEGITIAQQRELERYITDPTPGNLLALQELTRRYLNEGAAYLHTQLR